MDILGHLALGLSVAITPINLIYAFVGVLVGTLIGVLPGIGPVATIAMLLPTTYGLPPVTCWPASTTAPRSAAPPPPSWSTCRARCRRSSPCSTDTRWRVRGGPDRRCASQPSARSSPAPL